MNATEFVARMTRLRACYPQRVADQQHWQAQVSRYWDELEKRSGETVAEALDTAWREFPGFFPALGELMQHVDRIARRKTNSATVLRLPEVSSAPGIITPAVQAAIDAVKSIR